MPLDLLFFVPRYPRLGTKIDGEGLTIQGGGPVPNVLVGLSRLGCRTALITALSDDLIGQLGRQELTQAGVDDRFVVCKRGRSDTAVGLIEKQGGKRTMVLNREIHVTANDITPNRYPQPRLIHLDGRDMAATLKLARWGRRIGATVTFDIGSIRNDVSAVFPLVDHLVVADSYALPFTGSRGLKAALTKLRRYCPGTVVITAGTRGATGIEDDVVIRERAFRVRAVDTTGAGDAFHVGYLYGLLNGASFRERLLLGNAVAALNCMQPGARGGLPNRKQLNRFLKRRVRRYA